MQDPIPSRSRHCAVPLHIRCHHSLRLQLLVTGIGLFAGSMLVLLAGLYSAWFAAGLPVLVVYARQVYRCHVGRTSPGAVTELFRGSDGDWQIQGQSGVIEQAMLLGDSIVLPGMIILRFRLAENRRIRSVILMPDALGQEKYRRVCVQLLTHGPVSSTR